MNCPHCQKVLPEKYSATYCPYCGEAVVIEENVARINNPSVTLVRIRWPLFFLILLAPPLLATLSSFLGRNHDGESVSAVIASVGGIASGVTCGAMLAMRVARTNLGRLGLGLLFAGIFVVVCVTLNFFGCMAGGYQFNMR